MNSPVDIKRSGEKVVRDHLWVAACGGRVD